MTHCTVDSLMWRSVWIDGIATLTIATSRIVMKNAAPTTARTSHLFLWFSVIAPGAPSVSKVPASRENHSGSGPLDCLDDLGVALRPARLDDRPHAAGERLLRPVREGEEGIGGEHRAFEVVVELLRLLEGDPHRIHAALLPGADPDRLQVLRDHDRVRPDVLADAPREQQVSPLPLAQRSGDDVHRVALVAVPVPVLHEQAAGHALVVELFGRERAPLAVGENPRVRLRLPGGEGVRLVVGSEEHVDELFGKARGEPGADRAVHRADHSEGRERIGCEGALVRLVDRRGDGDTACIRVLNDHADRQRELAQQHQRAGEIVQVVEGEVAAVELLDVAEQRPARVDFTVIRGALMRILAVREVLHLLERERERLGQPLTLGEPARDRGFVGGGARERGRGESVPGLGGERSVLPELVEHSGVLLSARDRRDVGEVLCRCAQHRRPADVDHLDGVLHARSVTVDDRAERIEVDADEVEGLDLLLVERLEVVGAVAAGEDPAVNSRMQRLHAAAEQLGRLGHVFDVRDLQALLLEEPGRAAAGDELETELVQPARELVEPRLVIDRDQRAHVSPGPGPWTCPRRSESLDSSELLDMSDSLGPDPWTCPRRSESLGSSELLDISELVDMSVSPGPGPWTCPRRSESLDSSELLDISELVDMSTDLVPLSSRTTCGRSRCSTACSRCTSVSRGSSGTASCTMTGPLSSRSSTRWTVTPVASTPAASASSIACAPGNFGSSDGCTLTMRSGKRVRNGAVSRCM